MKIITLIIITFLIISDYSSVTKINYLPENYFPKSRLCQNDNPIVSYFPLSSFYLNKKNNKVADEYIETLVFEASKMLFKANEPIICTHHINNDVYRYVGITEGGQKIIRLIKKKNNIEVIIKYIKKNNNFNYFKEKEKNYFISTLYIDTLKSIINKYDLRKMNLFTAWSSGNHEQYFLEGYDKAGYFVIENSGFSNPEYAKINRIIREYFHKIEMLLQK